MRKGIQRLLALLVVLPMFYMVPTGVLANAAPSVSYCTHVQNMGWQDYSAQGDMSGTEGKGLRLEGIRIALNEAGYDLGIEYQTHIQNIGWETGTAKGWSSTNGFSGTEGLGYRLEAIQIKLTGADAGKFDVYYQVHAQNMGWLGLAKNGESAGTAGYGYRLEGIRIEIVPVGTAAPGWSVAKAEPFYENPLSLYPSIASEIEELNWKNQYVGQLYYYYEDLSNDGIPELIIGKPVTPQNFTVFPYSGKFDHQVSLIYQIINGTPNIIVGRDAQIRGRYYLDANNNIIDFGSGGANYHGWSYYKINGYDLNFIESVHLDTYKGEVYSLREQNEKLIKYLTKSEAYAIFDKYSIKTNIEWTPLVF